MLVKKPPMGWNSWNTFAEHISESLLRETADAMADNGLLDAGYQYVVIDDCWSERERAEDGHLLASHEKFPGGMKALADHIHSRGLKFGMYSCTGVRTCADYPGSFEHEFLDAQTFAEWGVDLLKYDFCYKPDRISGELLYRRMAMALRNSGRDILFSACNWGCDESEKWIRSTGAHMWRSTGDIFDNWDSIKSLVLAQLDKACYGAVGCFNDMDMLVVGMHGNGNVGLGGCTDEEYRTHFSVWCMLNSPLMIGCDVRNMTPATREILLNREMIAINQDPEGRQPYIAINANNERFVWVKPLENGDYAILFANLADSGQRIWVSWWDLGLPHASGYAFQLRDLWKHEDLGVFKDGFGPGMPAHSCVVVRASLVKA